LSLKLINTPNAAGAFYCLIVMLEDTLRYVGENLDDAWRKREAHHAQKKATTIDVF